MTTRFASALALIAVLAGTAAADSTPGEIRADDVIARPGSTVTIKAKLERQGVMGINPDVEDEPLDFFLIAHDGDELAEAKFLGTGKTDDDGVATLDWKPPETGRYRVEVRVRQGSDYVALPAPACVAVPPADRKVILIQLDRTVSEATNLQMWRGKANAEIPAVEGAKQVLEALASSYQLVYLTDLDASFTSKFKAWLELRQIPPAPVVFWDLFDSSLSHSTYMDKLVGKLVKELPQASIGIGGHLDDARAFVKHGLAGIVLSDDVDEDERRPEEIEASTWAQALGHVVQIYASHKLLLKVTRGSAAEAKQALDQLSLLGPAGLGYMHRYRHDRDLDLAASATLVAARLRAAEAFVGSLDVSSANAALVSVLAAWRQGERAVVLPLYLEREAGLNEPIPVFRRAETVSRNEPAPGKVAFRVRLIPDQGEPKEKDLVFVQEGDRWLLDVERGF